MGIAKGLFPQEVKEKALKISNGYCCHREDCLEKVTEFHHELPNTEPNRKRFPLFIKSIFNCCPINHGCHMTKRLPTIKEPAAQAYEWYLGVFLGLAADKT